MSTSSIEFLEVTTAMIIDRLGGDFDYVAIDRRGLLTMLCAPIPGSIGGMRGSIVLRTTAERQRISWLL
jgi:hypothetical protein